MVFRAMEFSDRGALINAAGQNPRNYESWLGEFESIDNHPFDDKNSFPSLPWIKLIFQRWFKKKKGGEREKKENEKRREEKGKESSFIFVLARLLEEKQTWRNNRLYDEINYYFNEYETWTMKSRKFRFNHGIFPDASTASICWELFMVIKCKFR